MIIMSVDLGKARTGIALCDKHEMLAFPKTVIKEHNTAKLVEKICEIAREEKVQQIVVGLPKNMDGTLGFRAQECTEIAEMINTQSNIETTLWDERCTTQSAYVSLDMSGTYGKKRKDSVDMIAAVIILESYLTFKKNKK